jgi:hypothetical protein
MEQVLITITEQVEEVNLSVCNTVEQVNISVGDIIGSMTFLSGIKVTGIDSGTFGDISITDDYLYICVTGGIAGVAIWKKSLLFQSI